MEKRTSKDPIQEDLQSQNLELNQKEKSDSGDLQSNRQLLEDDKPTHNVIKQNFFNVTEQNKRSSKQETGINVKQEVEKLAGKSLAQTQSSVQTEADSVHQTYGEREDAEILERERNNRVKEMTENPNEILNFPNPKTTAEYDSNGAALRDLNRIDRNKKLQINIEFKQIDQSKTLTVFKGNDLQQLFEELGKHNRARNKLGVITQEEKVPPNKLSESLEGKGTLYDEQYQEKRQMEETLNSIVVEYFEEMKVDKKEKETCSQESTNIFNNSKEIQHKSKENVTYEMPESNWNGNPLEQTSNKCHSEYANDVLEKSQDLGKDTAARIRGSNSECPKQSNDYETFKDLQSNEIIAHPGTIHYMTSLVRNKTGETKIKQNGNPEKTSTAPKQNSIQISEIPENEKLQKTVELQQKNDFRRKLSILNSKLEDLQQPCEDSEENGNVRAGDIAMQEESATPDKVSETETTQSNLRKQNTIQSEREQKKILTDFFYNQVPVQQRIERTEDILIVQEQNSILLSEPDSNDAPQQNLGRISENEEFDANAELHQRDLPRKLSVPYSKGSLQQPREDLKENIKIRNIQAKIRQEESAMPNKRLEPLAEGEVTLHDAQYQEKMQQEEKLKLIIANFFEENKVNQQEKGICNQKNTHTSDTSNGKDHLSKSKEIAISKKSEGNSKGNLREPGETCTKCRSESKYDLLSGFQEQRNDATRGNQDPTAETKTKPECSKLSKDYATSHKRITADPQKTKGYITSRWLDRSKMKGYVTFPHQRSEDETIHSNTSIRMSLDSQIKGYVKSQSNRQNIIPVPKPPIHVLMRANSFQRFLSDPGPSTDMHMLDPSRASLRTKQLNEEKEAPRRPLSQQFHFPQNQQLCLVSENEVPIEEMCPDAATETDELEVKRSGATLKVHTPPQGKGISDFMRRFRLPLFGLILLVLLLVLSLHFIRQSVTNKFHNGDLNFESTLNESRHTLNIPLHDIKQYIPTKSLDSKVNISEAHLIDSFDNFTFTVEGFNATNSLADLDPEIISMMNYSSDDVNTPDINSESTVATFMTDVVVRLINFDFGVTDNVNDIDAITPVSDYDINAIHPAAELDTDD